MEVRCWNGVRIHSAVEQDFVSCMQRNVEYSISTVIKGQEKESQEKSSCMGS